MNTIAKIKLKKLIVFLSLFTFSKNQFLAQYTKLYDFSGTGSGSNPLGSLVIYNGYLFGMTKVGNNIFRIKSDGTDFSNMRNFSFSDGNTPAASFYFDGVYLYGTNQYGGGSWGTVFKITPDGTVFEKLYNCGGSANGNGAYPLSTLISDGLYLYGTTTGGSANYGSVFKIKPDGTGYSQFNFSTTNGSRPHEGVVLVGGYLYGLTQYGGTNGAGAIYKIKTDGTDFSAIFSFSNTTGKAPYGKLISDGTYLYGMNSDMGPGGYGALFKIKPDGTEYTILHNFGSLSSLNGSTPWGSLFSDGTYLYGMTKFGGLNSKGVIFKIKSDGSEFTRLFDFDGINGEAPQGDLVSDGQFLYGMTYLGGANNKGVIFKIDKNTVVGFDEMHNIKNELIISPNPVAENIRISVLSNHFILKEQECTITNVLGQVVLTKKVDISESFDLNLFELEDGIYFVKVGSLISKFIKE